MSHKPHLSDKIKRRQLGATAIEYALIIAVIAAVAIVIESELGNKSFSLIRGTATALDEVSEQL